MKAAGGGKGIFCDWPTSALEDLINMMRPGCFRAGEPIAHQGDRGSSMYFLVGGWVAVVFKAMKSKRRSIEAGGNWFISVGPGSYFGEFLALTEEPRMASLYCVQNVDAWAL